MTRSSSWSSGTTADPSGALWVHRWRFSPLDEVSGHQMKGSVTAAGHGLSHPTVWGSPGLESPCFVMLARCLTTGQKQELQGELGRHQHHLSVDEQPQLP